MAWDNLPPGCSDDDIPGNRPIDEALGRFLDENLEWYWEKWDGEKEFVDAQEELEGNPIFENYIYDRFEAWR